MRLLMMHHVADVGGGTQSLLDVVEMLAPEVELQVCAPPEPVWLSEQVVAGGAKFVACPLPMPVFYHYNGMGSGVVRVYFLLKCLVTFLRHRRAWATFLADRDIDILAVNSAVLCLFGPIAKAAGIPARVCFVRETFPNSKGSILTRILYTILGRYFSKSFFLSQYDLRLAGLRQGSAEVIPDCIRPNSLTRYDRSSACVALGLDAAKTNVLYVGGASRLKGYDTILEAATALGDDGVAFLIAGSSSIPSPTLAASLRGLILNPGEWLFARRVRRLLGGLQEAEVRLLGRHSNMSLLYSAADVVVFPSRRPHQARPIYEAGFYGLPIVISDFECTSEFVSDGRNGLVVAPSDPDALAQALRTLTKDSDTRHRLGAENSARFRRTRDYGRTRSLLRSTLADLAS